jgi:hypothetical protein
MGLYDTLKVKCKCPACLTEIAIPFQTKSLDNKMQEFTPGDRVSETEEGYDFIELTGICKSDVCLKNDPQGHGTIIGAKIRLKDGIITNNIFDVRISDGKHP